MLPFLLQLGIKDFKIERIFEGLDYTLYNWNKPTVLRPKRRLKVHQNIKYVLMDIFNLT